MKYLFCILKVLLILGLLFLLCLIVVKGNKIYNVKYELLKEQLAYYKSESELSALELGQYKEFIKEHGYVSR